MGAKETLKLAQPLTRLGTMSIVLAVSWAILEQDAPICRVISKFTTNAAANQFMRFQTVRTKFDCS